MNIQNLLRGSRIDQGLEHYRSHPGAVLLDVRTPGEYSRGHIPGSVNLPLQYLDNADEIIENVDTPLYVYCRSGARSNQAAFALQQMGYKSVTNLGGMTAYGGKVEY